MPKILSLRWTFLLSFLTIVVLASTSGLVNYLAERAILDQFTEVVEVSSPAVVALNRVNTIVVTIQGEATSAAAFGSGDADMLEHNLEEIEEGRATLDYWLTQYEQAAPGAGAESLRRLSTQVVDASEELVNISLSGGTDTALLNKLEELEEYEETYFFLVNSLLDTKRVEFDDQLAAAISTANDARDTTLIVLAISIIGAVMIGLFIADQTVRPILRLQRVAEQIRAGQPIDHTAKFPNNEVGVLAVEFYRMADALEQKAEEAKAASAFKTQLLARVSHELRTPLGAVIGIAGMLASDGLRAEQRELVTFILKYSGELEDMVNELLEQSRWEISGKGRKLKVVDISPRTMLEEVTTKCSTRATEKQVNLITDIADDLPQTVEADATKLRQILNNLVTNAIKFTDEGSVTVRGYVPIAGQWAFDVTDTGSGIPHTDTDRIFEPFRQVDETDTRPQKGVGLGLAIVKQFVEAMGGSITVHSTVGQGSTFTVMLPTMMKQRAQREQHYG